MCLCYAFCVFMCCVCVGVEVVFVYVLFSLRYLYNVFHVFDVLCLLSFFVQCTMFKRVCALVCVYV